MQHLSITDDVINEICKHVQSGACYRDAYLLAGINHYTGSHWRKVALEKARDGISADDDMHVKLFLKMDAAKAAYYQSLVKTVNEAAANPKCWQAAMTLLERTQPEIYSRFTRLKEYTDLDIDPDQDTPVQIISKIMKAIMSGKISAKEGEQMSNVVAALVKTDEVTEVKDMLAKTLAFREELKKDG